MISDRTVLSDSAKALSVKELRAASSSRTEVGSLRKLLSAYYLPPPPPSHRGDNSQLSSQTSQMSAAPTPRHGGSLINWAAEPMGHEGDCKIMDSSASDIEQPLLLINVDTLQRDSGGATPN